MASDASKDNEVPLLSPETHQNVAEDAPLPENDGKNLWLGLMLLSLCLLSYGSMIPILASLPPTSNLVKLLWRYQAGMLTFLPLALLAKDADGNRWSLKKIFTHGATVEIMVTAVCWVSWMLGVLVASEIYSFMLADMFGNSSAVFILIYRHFKHIPISRGEFLGVAISVFGAAVVFFGPTEGGHSGNGNLALCLVLGLFAAMTGAVYMVKTESIVQGGVPLDVYIFANAFFGFIFLAIIYLLTEESELSFNAHSGLFGVFHPSNFKNLLLLSLFCGLCVSKAGNQALVYTGSLITAVTFLLAPPLVGVESYFIGVDHLPNWSSWLSTFIMMIGLCVIILFPATRKGEKAEIETRQIVSKSKTDRETA